MTCVNVTSVNVLDNPSRFVNPFQFEISFECIAHITDDIEWKLTYVGSAESDQHDQELDSVLVGPMQVGGYKIVFQADAPDPRQVRASIDRHGGPMHATWRRCLRRHGPFDA